MAQPQDRAVAPEFSNQLSLASTWRASEMPMEVLLLVHLTLVRKLAAASHMTNLLSREPPSLHSPLSGHLPVSH